MAYQHPYSDHRNNLHHAADNDDSLGSIDWEELF